MVGIAATGSGKTFAFGIPALIHIMNIKEQGLKKPTGRLASPYVVILSPTRELAIQIKDTLDVFTKALGISSVCVYGGVPKWEQKKLLLENGGAEIVIATPGRFMDLLGFEWGSSTEINQDSCCISLDRVGYFILDEADRMLDLGFQKDIKKIADAMKQADKQTVMFRFES
jgi:ATP-dependent RNA helicase DBP3